MQSVEQWELGRLKEFAGNPRKNDHAVDAAAKAIAAFGFRVPILAKSDGMIIDGHLRLKAARQLGLETVPVLLADDLSEAQVRAFRLSVNKIADLAEWDADLLAFELDELRDLGFDLSLIGFAPGELNDLIGTPNTGFDPDEVPPAPVVPVSRTGDLWIMSGHRLLCGDSTRAEDVARLMGGAKADMVLSDPPYGINLDTRYSKAPQGSARCALKGREPKMRDYSPVIGDDRPFDARPLCVYFSAAKEQFWFGADYYRRTLSQDDMDGSWLVWDKRSEQTDAVVGSGFELIWSKQPHKRDILRFYWNGAFGVTDARKRMHPTQKPQGLLAEIVSRWSADGAIVADPFVGSGTTIIAAEMTGRACYALEIAPQYVDVSVMRWQQFTDKAATLDGDGRTFEEVKHARKETAAAADQ